MAREQLGVALWVEVAERLRARILSGEIGPGERLTEVDLATSFGISRGPVRDALRQLAHEGLVVESPRRGAVVSTLEDRDLIEVYAVREALESAAVELAVATAGDDEIAELGALLDEFEAPGGTYLDRAVHDLAFHRRLLEMSGNRRMRDIYEQMLLQTMLLMRTAAESRPLLRRRMPGAVHRDIVAALAARDPVAAREALARHYRHALERLSG